MANLNMTKLIPEEEKKMKRLRQCVYEKERTAHNYQMQEKKILLSVLKYKTKFFLFYFQVSAIT